ncbi:MAG: RHS repeat-associated core domain-containing protein, partial [Candidatus Sulfotelmatobacter sp.]
MAAGTGTAVSTSITSASYPGCSPGFICAVTFNVSSSSAIRVGDAITVSGNSAFFNQTWTVTSVSTGQLQSSSSATAAASGTGGTLTDETSPADSAIDIIYSFVDPVSLKNAGHVYGITNNLNPSRSQAFTYDQLNRISTAKTTSTTGTYCWGYQFNYDAWANLNSQAGLSGYGSCTEYSSSATADGNNHLAGQSYDTSGNTLTDGNNFYTWDGESQMKTAAGVTYAYDGDGRRAAKVGSKLYWYGSGGEILSETDASGNTQNDYIFFGGKRVADVPATGSALFYAEDTLGSSRVIVQSNGTLCYDGDFTPFGGERSYTSTCAQNYKFEGKERDTETQKDDFGAREYSWRFGRWLSSDWSVVPAPVPYANLNNPQTLNLYGMVHDDPESFADLNGHYLV